MGKIEGDGFSPQEEDGYDILDTLDDGRFDRSDTEIEVMRRDLIDELRPYMERLPDGAQVGIDDLRGSIRFNNPALPPEDN